MYKGKAKQSAEPVSLSSLAKEAGISKEVLSELEHKDGRSAAKTVCRSVLRARRCGIPDPEEYVRDISGKYGVSALSKIFPQVRDPRTYTDLVNARMKSHLFDSICKMNGWAWVFGDVLSFDDNGQVVKERVELKAIIALEGSTRMGMLISHTARAPFDVIDPRKWRPNTDDADPPFEWRIGMFEGDPENKVELTPIMDVASDLDCKVRVIKDMVDHTLVRAAIGSNPEGSSRGWQRLGEFPDIGAPDLTDVADPVVRRMLTLGLSGDGFCESEESPNTKKKPPLSLINRLIHMGL